MKYIEQIIKLKINIRIKKVRNIIKRIINSNGFNGFSILSKLDRINQQFLILRFDRAIINKIDYILFERFTITSICLSDKGLIKKRNTGIIYMEIGFGSSKSNT